MKISGVWDTALLVFVSLLAVTASAGDPDFAPLRGGVEWSSVFQGLSVRSMTLDADGNTILVGTTGSPGLPVTANALRQYYIAGYCLGIRVPGNCVDGYMAKLGRDGKLIYGSYIGGTADDTVDLVTTDDSGAMYILGSSASGDLPVTTTPLLQPAEFGTFLMKFRADGGLQYSLRLSDKLTAAVMRFAEGALFVAGGCRKDTFPPLADAYQGSTSVDGTGCLLKLSADGHELLRSTYLTGPVYSLISDMVVQSGKIYMTGAAASADFPTTSKSWVSVVPDRFTEQYGTAVVAIMDSDGKQLLASAVFGGESSDTGRRLAIGPGGEIIVAGETTSEKFPVTPGAFQTTRQGFLGVNGFVIKFAPDLSRPIYSTFLSSDRYENIAAVWANPDGSAAVYGSTASTLFPITVDALESCHDTDYNPTATPFVTRLSADGTTLDYSSYLNTGRKGSAVQGFGWAGGRMVWSLIGMSPDLSYYGGTIPAQPPDLTVATVASFQQRLAPTQSRFCVAQAADLSTTGISAGQFITLFDSALGPPEGLIAPFTDGRFPVELGGTVVLVNGSPAPLLYVQSGQVNALVPADLRADSTITVSLRSQGVLRGSVTLPVSAYVPALFRRWTTREIVANHDDGTPVTDSQPANAGEIIRLYGTGFGPLSTSSLLTNVPVFSIGAGNAEVLFAGQPSEGPPGLMLFRVRVPDQPPSLNPIFVSFSVAQSFIYPPLTLPMARSPKALKAAQPIATAISTP